MSTSRELHQAPAKLHQVGGFDKSSKTCRDAFGGVKKGTCRGCFPSRVCVFLPSLLMHWRECSPPVWFVLCPDSPDWLPVAPHLSPASPQLSRCLLSPTAALPSVSPALLCRLLHFPDVSSSLTPCARHAKPHTFSLFPPRTSLISTVRDVALACAENTAKLFSCCVARLSLFACYCISSRQLFRLIFNFSWKGLLSKCKSCSMLSYN